MAKKYYAVARGKTPGIYFTWEDCKAQVENFSGATYKGFATLQEAEDYIESILGKKSVSKEESARQMDIADFMKELEEPKHWDCEDVECETSVSDEVHLVVYVDGSYDHSQLRYAYGCVMVLPEGEVTLNGSDNHEDYVSMRNVAGEIMGSEQAILWAIEHGYRKVTIYYDYEGIEKWANGIWKTNKIGTQRYKEFVNEKRKQIEIRFQKVAAHTGVRYNEMADQLAKEALGI